MMQSSESSPNVLGADLRRSFRNHDGRANSVGRSRAAERRNARANTIYTVPRIGLLGVLDDRAHFPHRRRSTDCQWSQCRYFDLQSSGANKVITSVAWRQTISGSVVLANKGDVLSTGVRGQLLPISRRCSG